jgi:hypothetical protein
MDQIALDISQLAIMVFFLYQSIHLFLQESHVNPQLHSNKFDMDTVWHQSLFPLLFMQCSTQILKVPNNLTPFL